MGYKNGYKKIYTLRERETKREGYRQVDAVYKNGYKIDLRNHNVLLFDNKLQAFGLCMVGHIHRR